jgi:hypothetical protein
MRIWSPLILVLLISCTPKQDLEKTRQEIVRLLQQERKAHFTNNVDLFISEFADSMISINKGKVTIAGPVENRKRIEPYFNSVKFIRWDDVAEPIIRISEDGSLAYAVVQKQVILTYPDTLGKPFYDTTNYAWTSIYRKQKGEWKVEANISTTQK